MSLPAGRAIAVGAVAGLAWLATAWVLVPASDGFVVAVDRATAAGAGRSEIGDAAYAMVGPVLVVAVPVALALRYGLVAPLLVTAAEVGSTLSEPGAGDAIGTLASLLWPLGLLAIAALALCEYGIRRVIRPRPAQIA
jgi:hypothetical protein